MLPGKQKKIEFELVRSRIRCRDYNLRYHNHGLMALGENTLAAKRAKSGEGDQDFGFLSSGNVPDADSAQTDFGFNESATESSVVAFDQFTAPTDSGHPDFQQAPADADIPPALVLLDFSGTGQSVNAESTPEFVATPLEAVANILTPLKVPVSVASPVKTAKPAVVPDAGASTPQVQSTKSATSETPRDPQPADQPVTASPDTESSKGSGKLSGGLLGYAIALTLLFLGLLFTGRLSLTGNPVLESLPDLRPLPPNEFRRIEDGAELPKGHVLKLGESRQFGDVVVTPVKLTKEPLKFQGFLSGEINEKLTSQPVLKLC